MSTIDNFVDKFYNLEGVTLKEKNKSFHLLLEEFKSAQPGFVDLIVQRLQQPRNYLEDSLKVELLLYFRRTDDLLATLKNGDEIRSSKIIRQNWFVQNIIEKFPPSRLVDELFPTLSFSIRTKFLKQYLKYEKSEEQIENLFNLLSKKYGTNVALVLLPGCSVEKIKGILQSKRIRLSVPQMKALFDKNKSIIQTYFDLKRNDDDENVDKYEWGPFFKYVKTKDPNFIIELREKYKIYVNNLGRMSTKKFLSENKEKMMSNPEKYWYVLKKDALVRKLGADFPDFYKKLLPKRLTELKYDNSKSLIYHYSKNRRYELFSKVFEELYGKTLWDNKEYMDERMIEFVNDKEEQTKWIEAFENRSNFKRYSNRVMLCGMACESMAFADDEDLFVGETAIKERKTVFNTLISTCKMTKDYSAFLNILESFCERYRNSDVTILYNFLRSVHTDLDMTQLKDEHWKYIREIIGIQIFKKQQTYHPIFLEYIKFLYLQNRPIENEIRSLLELIPQDLSKFEYKNDAFQKAVFQTFLDILPSIKDEKFILAIDVATVIIEWNHKHPKDTIAINQHPSILSAVRKLKEVAKVDRKPMRVFKYLICCDGANNPDLVDIYWSNFKILNDRTINWWFAKYDPETLKKHLDKIGIVLKDKNTTLVHTLKKYDHIEIPESITKMCLEELAKAETSKRERIVKILLLFMRKEDVIKNLQEHVPKVDKVNVTVGDGDAQRNYEFQCALVKHLKSTIYLKDSLPYLLNYCKGDVLSAALPSLYASFYRLPEHELKDALQQLSTKAVSTRKHAIYLSSLVLPVNQVLLKYTSVIEKEKNRSILQSLFVDCFRYFSKNDVEECWPILENYIKGLTKQQKDILKMLKNASRIPKNYRAQYVQQAWEILDKFKKDGTQMDGNMDNLLRNLTKSDVQILPINFCLNILRDKLFNYEDRDLQDSVFQFTRKFLLCSGDDVRVKIEGLFEVVRGFKKAFWDDKVKKIDVLKVMHNLCVDIFRDYLSEDNIKCDNDQFPKIFHECWKKEFSVEETFEEHQFLDFLAYRVEGQTLPQQITEAFSKALATYGNLIVGNFKFFVETYLKVTLKGDDQIIQTMKFLDALLDCNSSPEQCVLVLEMLPCGYLNDEDKKFQEKLIERLAGQGEIVKIRLYGKLK